MPTITPRRLSDPSLSAPRPVQDFLEVGELRPADLDLVDSEVRQTTTLRQALGPGTLVLVFSARIRPADLGLLPRAPVPLACSVVEVTRRVASALPQPVPAGLGQAPLALEEQELKTNPTMALPVFHSPLSKRRITVDNNSSRRLHSSNLIRTILWRS